MPRHDEDPIEHELLNRKTKCSSCPMGWISLGVLALLIVGIGAFVAGRATSKTGYEQRKDDHERALQESRAAGQSGKDFIDGFDAQARENLKPENVEARRKRLNANNNDDRVRAKD
ncbi:hypothetical protein BH11PLA2_BH11PLA2_23340 [soil metagenome]